MILKIESTRKSGPSAASYVMGGMDSQHRQRAGVEVLVGDPARFSLLTSSLAFRHTYSSLEASFALTDAPTAEDVRAVVRDVVSITTLGTSKGRTDHLVVKHTSQQGRIDVHFLVPRIDLVTGNSFNPTPPGFSTFLAALQHAWNCEKGWADPSADKRRRLYQLPRPPSPHRQTDLARHYWARDWIENTSKEVIERLKDGRIRSRWDVVRYLETLARVESSREDRLIVHVPFASEREGSPLTRKITLRGLLYCADFELGWVMQRVAGLGLPTPADQADPQRAARARQRLKPLVDARAAHFEAKFAPPDKPTGKASPHTRYRVCLPVGPARHLATETEREDFERGLSRIRALLLEGPIKGTNKSIDMDTNQMAECAPGGPKRADPEVCSGTGSDDIAAEMVADFDPTDEIDDHGSTDRPSSC